MISDETKAYYDLKKRNEVRESAKRLRKQFLRYKDAEIVYSIQHKKLMELASEAGAIYRMDSTVLITQRLADSNRKFSESDAWLDLWCHTVWQDSGNIFSLLAPTVQFERRKALLTLETMGQRWKWEKTKVWRFFQKYKDVFALYRLPGSYGCLIFNQLYQTGTEVSLPTQANVVRIIEEIRISAANVHIEGTDHERLSRMIAWFSVKTSAERIEKPGENSKAENRVALSSPIIRAYFSLHCWNCKNCNYDCKEVVYISPLENFENIRGPCVHFPEFKKSKESYYERE